MIGGIKRRIGTISVEASQFALPVITLHRDRNSPRVQRARQAPNITSGSASASGAKVENLRRLLRSMIATAPPLRWPVLKTARKRPFGCSAIPRLSASSISKVGCWPSVRRKIAAVVIEFELRRLRRQFRDNIEQRGLATISDRAADSQTRCNQKLAVDMGVQSPQRDRDIFVRLQRDVLLKQVMHETERIDARRIIRRRIARPCRG